MVTLTARTGGVNGRLDRRQLDGETGCSDTTREPYTAVPTL